MSSTEGGDTGGIVSNNIFTMNLKSDEEVQTYFGKNEDLLENEEKHLIESGEVEKRSLSQRLFGPIDPGSIRGSIFNLAILSLGSGCLAMPQTFAQMSIVVAVVDIILAGMAAYWTLSIMIMASEKFKIYNYSQLVNKLFGKGMSLFLDFTMLIYIFGVLILYQVIAYKLIGGIVNEIGNFGFKSIDDFLNNSFWSQYNYKFPVMYALAFLIVLPLCLLKDISKMRFTSIFGIFSLFFLIIIIIVQTPWYYIDYLNKPEPKPKINIWDISTGFTDQMYFFKGTATLFYAYSCHVGAFPVYRALKNNIMRRVQKVFARSILLDGTFYTIVGITGYLTSPIKTPDLIIERQKLFDTDIIMTIGWIAFVFTLIMKIPANYNSFRLTLIGLFGYDDANMSQKLYKNISKKLLKYFIFKIFRNFLITIPTLAVTCFIGVIYNNIIGYIHLMGSFCAVIIAFLLPGIFELI
jgi:amino acid permease